MNTRRRRRQEGEQEEQIELKMTPMIDCVFLLLIFFIFATKFPKQEGKLEAKLPSQQATLQERKPTDPPTIVVIEISKDGQMRVNDIPLTLDELTAKLARLAELWPTQPVIISGDPYARHQYIVDALNACHRANIKNISFTGL